MNFWKLFAPRVGQKATWLSKLFCKLANHPAGPLWAGAVDGVGADLRCRACGEINND